MLPLHGFVLLENIVSGNKNRNFWNGNELLNPFIFLFFLVEPEKDIHNDYKSNLGASNWFWRLKNNLQASTKRCSAKLGILPVTNYGCCTFTWILLNLNFYLLKLFLISRDFGKQAPHNYATQLEHRLTRFFCNWNSISCPMDVFTSDNSNTRWDMLK